MHRIAFVDDQLIARDFHTDDVVRKAGIRDFVLSPYVGRVLYSNVDTGKVEVQWPWGAELETASELVKDTSGYYVPTEADQSYSTYEGARNIDSKAVVKQDEKFRKSLASVVVDKYEERTLPLYHAACEAWHCGMPEIETLSKMAVAFGPKFGEDSVRLTISNVYELGRRLAIYWQDKKRQYRVTQKEKSSKKLYCPRCRNLLKPRVFTHGDRVLACSKCGFTVHPKDLRGREEQAKAQEALEE